MVDCICPLAGVGEPTPTANLLAADACMYSCLGSPDPCNDRRRELSAVRGGTGGASRLNEQWTFAAHYPKKKQHK
jgi:hypothetical protein